MTIIVDWRFKIGDSRDGILNPESIGEASKITI
jgi:hypothetical protein